MTQTAAPAQQPCTGCGGTGQVSADIYNTVTQTWTNIPQPCLACL